jgi:hypothetical protein
MLHDNKVFSLPRPSETQTEKAPCRQEEKRLIFLAVTIFFHLGKQIAMA